ncbi:TPA_asm: phage tail assembly protein T [Salmonella enterica subsp. enterica serovar Java]|nr:phage tail assembly protein T [Salmonella enterica]HAC6879129.1 phage tail assembly protein T [Salmonella enterica subsp. enterica serovar Java]
MKLAREFSRPDWRAMLAGMSSTEYGDWKIFYRDNFFHDAQLDAHFSGLLYTISTLFFADPELTPDSFSILATKQEPVDNSEPDDDMLMAKAAGISGGVRYVPDGSR